MVIFILIIVVVFSDFKIKFEFFFVVLFIYRAILINKFFVVFIFCVFFRD